MNTKNLHHLNQVIVGMSGKWREKGTTFKKVMHFKKCNNVRSFYSLHMTFENRHRQNHAGLMFMDMFLHIFFRFKCHKKKCWKNSQYAKILQILPQRSKNLFKTLITYKQNVKQYITLYCSSVRWKEILESFVQKHIEAKDKVLRHQFSVTFSGD